MNLQLHHVISDITGVTGLAIIDAVMAGERDTKKLAALRDPRIRTTKEIIAKSLVGDYRPEHIFALQQSVRLFRVYQEQIGACELDIERLIRHVAPKTDAPLQPLPPAKDSVRKCKVMPAARAMTLRQEGYRLLGVDLTAVPGISALTVQTIVAEIGPDLSKFRSAAAFSSWMGLSPNNEISGGKILRAGTRHVKNRVAVALRMAAQSLQVSQSALGAFYRRMRTRLGVPKAITAAAHKLARIIYHMIIKREPYEDSAFNRLELEYKHSTENRLRAQARALGFALVSASEVP
ncbi:MAG: IS110 family transposase [Acidobacteriaceae bacterium]|nr:IS110 family transposase [Acidobacteriaceae bacterium]